MLKRHRGDYNFPFVPPKVGGLHQTGEGRDPEFLPSRLLRRKQGLRTKAACGGHDVEAAEEKKKKEAAAEAFALEGPRVQGQWEIQQPLSRPHA